jgi:general L-amino acid transport system permease protein
MSTPQKPPKPSWSWRSQAFRGFIYQVVTVTVILALVLYLAHNTQVNMKNRGIQSGWDFMLGGAGFDIGESLFPYDSADPYWKAFLIGFSNTLRVAVLGIILTTILGTLIGVGRFSRNALVRGLCLCYVEFFRNIPILLQLLMWYLMMTEVLPSSSEPITLGPLFLSKGGLNFPIPVWATGQYFAAIGMAVAIVVAFVYRRYAIRSFERTGVPKSLFWVPLGIVIGFGVLGWLVGGAPMEFNSPKQGDFAIENGGSLSPEYLSVLLGLTIYTAAFVAEVVRGGIQSVAMGQSEAAAALGLSRGQTMRLVTLPQALRVIIPPVTNQYLNLTKNSSLAVAIGYPDVVSIANTAINQTGRAVECIAVIMLVYLTTSLTTSFGMNWYNNRSAIKER